MATFGTQRALAYHDAIEGKKKWENIVQVRLPAIQADLTAVRQMIIANKDGSFQAGDLPAFDAMAMALITLLQDYANSLP